MANYITEKSKRKITTDAFIGGGSTADVFNIKQNSTECAKILKNPTDDDHKKLLDMMEIGLDPYVDGILAFAWPTDILLDSRGKFSGFLMPLIPNAKITLYSAILESRDKIFPHWDIWYNVRIARNLALLLAMLHANHISLGDLNQANFIINQNLSVILIDLDSVNYTTKDGTIYFCPVARPELRAPEIQGRNLKTRQLTNEHTDCFGLAIHIFQLLCLDHPFRCQIQPGESSSVSGPLQSIANGDCPYLPGSTATAPPKSKGMKDLPLEIQNLFIRCFRYNSMTACKKETIQNRPSAFEWFQALNTWLANSGRSVPPASSTQSGTNCSTINNASSHSDHSTINQSAQNTITTPKKHKNLIWIVVLCLLAVMAVGFEVYLYLYTTLPANGHVFYSIDKNAPWKLTVENGNKKNVCVKLVDVNTEEDVSKFFVRGNSSATVNVPTGEYLVRYTFGSRWQWKNEDDLFGSMTYYYECKEPLTFEENHTFYFDIEDTPDGAEHIENFRIDVNDF